MYLSEEPEYIEETAMLIEEVLRQRIAGMKNAAGYTTVQTFPKLLYVLEPLNLPKKEGDPERKEDGKYYYLSKLAAESVAKTMNPDFISQKVMKNKYAEYNDQGEMIHDGVFPCMGCRSFLSKWVDPETGKPKYYGRLTTP